MKLLLYLSLLFTFLAMFLGTGFANHCREREWTRARLITLLLMGVLVVGGASVGMYAAYWETTYGDGKKIADVLVEKRCKTVLRGTPQLP